MQTNDYHLALMLAIQRAEASQFPALAAALTAILRRELSPIMANTFKEAVTFNTEQPTARSESDREAIATIIQSGHIGHKTSDEIARDVVLHVNRTLRPDRTFYSLTHIHA